MMHFSKTNLKSRYKTLGKMIYNQYHIYNYILQVKYKIQRYACKIRDIYVTLYTSVVKTRPILNNTYNSKMLKQVLFLKIYFDGFSFWAQSGNNYNSARIKCMQAQLNRGPL